jgi:hypothetical protein
MATAHAAIPLAEMIIDRRYFATSCSLGRAARAFPVVRRGLVFGAERSGLLVERYLVAVVRFG